MSKTAIVITTINGPEHGSLPQWREVCKKLGWRLYIALDVSSPSEWLHFEEALSISEQARRWPELHAASPTKHYSRKNFGYLAALADGADRIFETDDDNWPYYQEAASIATAFKQSDKVSKVSNGSASGSLLGWVNSFYPFYKDENLWSRGGSFFAPTPVLVNGDVESHSVRQFMCRGEPDRDALSRLAKYGDYAVVCDNEVRFALYPGSYAPVNTQYTLWSGRQNAELMYVPWTCRHRMTDILRGWCMLPVLWRKGDTVSYHPPLVNQERNAHDLTSDLADEVQMYALAPHVPHALGVTQASYETALRNIARLHPVSIDLHRELASLSAWERALEKIR